MYIQRCQFILPFTIFIVLLFQRLLSNVLLLLQYIVKKLVSVILGRSLIN